MNRYINRRIEATDRHTNDLVRVKTADLEDFQEFVLKIGGEVLQPKQDELVRFRIESGEIGVIYSKSGRVGRGSKLAHLTANAFKRFSGVKP